MDETLKDEIKVTLIATGLDGSARRGKKDSGNDLKRITPKFVSDRRSSSSSSSYTSSVSDLGGDDAIFNRKLKPSMGNIDVPDFFKPGR